MPKSKGRKPKKAQLPPPAVPPALSRRLWEIIANLSRRFWTAVVAASVIVTIAASGLFFVPRLSVDISIPAESLKPFSASFSVVNTNIVPLNDVNFSIGFCKLALRVKTPSGATGTINVVGTPERPIDATVPPCATPNGSAYQNPAWLHHKLAPDEKFSDSMKSAMNLQDNQLAEGDITVIVTFRPWILPFHRRSEFRFVADQQPDGAWRWLPRTLDNR